jgi:transposase
MESQLYLISLYLSVEAIFRRHFGGVQLRSRGFTPALSDVEVITIELFGEFQGHGNDKSIWRYIGEHWLAWFPRLGSYKNFAKHCANLMGVKALIFEALTTPKAGDVFIVDGLPIPVCKFARAKRCKLFQGVAAFGFCAAKRETYYGFEGHLIVTTGGEIRRISLTPANAGEREAALHMVADLSGDMLADKGYVGAEFTRQMAERGIRMHTPLRDNMNDERPPELVKTIMDQRRYIETIIGKLVEQFSLLANKARDFWHLSNKIYRKLLSYMLALQIIGSTRFLES